MSKDPADLYVDLLEEFYLLSSLLEDHLHHHAWYFYLDCCNLRDHHERLIKVTALIQAYRNGEDILLAALQYEPLQRP